jgi:hypothetical protein
MPPHLLKNILNLMDRATREPGSLKVTTAYGQALTFDGSQAPHGGK